MKTAGTALRCPVVLSARHIPIEEKLQRYSLPSPSGCRIWVRARDKNGYGLVRQEGYANGRGAHRVAYELVNGPIPDGMVIDHLCRLVRCINPQHLQAVTQKKNVARICDNPGVRINRVLRGTQSRKTYTVVHRAKPVSA